MTLQEFYAARFGSDPYSLLEAARDELSELATMAGINWAACADNIQLNPRGGEERYSKYNGGAPEALEKSLKGRVEIYSRKEQHKSGISYPFVNFVQKGHDEGSWSGFSFLFAEYRREQQRIMRPWSHNLLKNWRVLNARQKPASAAPNSNG
ncbi:hypothetical protein [Klebsiella pneumoniae]|nr:hypothetical protein [Klebsiella pneumoniae]